MKLPIQIIKELVEKYSNDMELGKAIRWYIYWLTNKKKED